jgi:DNA primase
VWAIRAALEEDLFMRDITAIGTFGMHLSAGDAEGNHDQLNAFLTLRKEGLETVTIMWDGESKALERALRAADLLNRHGLKCKIAFLPKGKDPAEVSSEVVRQCIRDAKPFSRSLLVELRLRNPYR